MSDAYQFWRDSLAGKKPEIHADAPQAGRYRMRRFKDGPYLPVAIFPQDGALKAAVERDFAWLGGVVDRHYAGDDTDMRKLVGSVFGALAWSASFCRLRSVSVCVFWIV